MSTATLDVSSRDAVHALVETAARYGDITGVVHVAGVSPPARRPRHHPRRRPVRTALVLEEFGRRMIELSPVGRGGTPDEVGTVAALLMGAEGAFITGSDFLTDGGITASYFFGELAPR